MKKLLSILAAVGLTATTGTAVVACGTNDNDNKPKVKDITGAQMGVVTAGMTKATVQGMIVDAIKKVKGVDQNVTFNDVEADIKAVVVEGDKITVKAKDESAYITGSFDFTVGKAPVVKIDITSAKSKMQPVTAGMTKTKVEELILDAIKKVDGADQKVSAKDYDVAPEIKAVAVEGDKITVKAKDESAYITGSFDFTVGKAPVVKIDIAGAKDKMQSVTAGMTKTKVEELILDAVKKVDGVDQKVSAKDYDVAPEIKAVVVEGDKITVKAKDESAYITGSFDFTVGKAPVVKIDIAGAKDKMQSVTAGMTKTKVEELILDAVKKVDGVDQKVSAKDYDVVPEIKAVVVEGDKITVKAKDESAYITGSFDFTVGKAPVVKIDIAGAKDKMQSVTAGMTKTKVEELILDAVKKVDGVDQKVSAKDYDVAPEIKAVVVEGDKITVKAKDESAYITGSFDFTVGKAPVVKIDIAGAKDKMQSVTAGMTKTKVEELILDAVKKVDGVDQKVSAKDYDVVPEIKAVVVEGDKITVKAKDESAYITGSFDFTVGKAPVVKINIAGAKDKMQSVTAGMTKTKVEELILDAVKKVDGVDQKVSAKDYDVAPEIKAVVVEGDKITVKAKDESAYITGSFDFTVGKAHKNDQEIVDAINRTLFTKSVSVNSSAEEVKIGVGAKFIKDRLLTKEFNNLSNFDFHLIKITNEKSGEELSDSDLKKKGRIQVIINYDYGLIKDQNTKLLIHSKEIYKSVKRNEKLKELGDDLRNEHKGFSEKSKWEGYFVAIKDEINEFSFEFSLKSLEENRIAQNIIYDEIQLIIRTDFKDNKIDNITNKYFNPDTVVIDYKTFEYNKWDLIFTVDGTIKIDAKTKNNKDYEPINIKFKYSLTQLTIVQWG